jgi:hypothetical protein
MQSWLQLVLVLGHYTDGRVPSTKMSLRRHPPNPRILRLPAQPSSPPGIALRSSTARSASVARSLPSRKPCRSARSRARPKPRAAAAGSPARPASSARCSVASTQAVSQSLLRAAVGTAAATERALVAQVCACRAASARGFGVSLLELAGATALSARAADRFVTIAVSQVSTRRLTHSAGRRGSCPLRPG